MGLPAISSQIPSDLRQFLDRVREFVDSQSQNFVTKSDLSAAGVINTDQRGRVFAGTSAESSTIPPPAITGFTVTPTLANFILEWGAPAYPNHAYTEIWRAGTDDLGAAVRIATTASNMYADPIGQTGAARFYWVRAVSMANVTGAYNGTAGTGGTTGKVGNADLTDAIVTATKLAAGAIDAYDKFGTGIRPPGVGTTLPTLPDANYPNGALYFNTTDSTLYNVNAAGTTWVAVTGSVAASAITGLIVDAQLAGMAASKVTGTLSDSQLAAISAAKVTGTLTGTQVAAGTITGSNVAAYTLTAGNIAAATITGTEIAGATITGAKMVAGTVTSSQIATGTVVAGNIATGTITASQIAGSTITAGQIATGTVTATQMATGTITAGSGVIANGAIINALIGAAAVDSAKIATATIVGANIASATITGANIASASIGTAHIVNAAVDTLQVAGHAITVPVTAYTSTLTTPGSGGPFTLQSVTITTTGEVVDLDWALGTSVVNTSGGTYFYLYRDAANLVQYSNNCSGTSEIRTVSARYSEQPAAGTYTYYLKANLPSHDFTEIFMKAGESKR